MNLILIKLGIQMSLECIVQNSVIIYIVIVEIF
jgi:hypothetical protein